jgi:hypothetical protein
MEVQIFDINGKRVAQREYFPISRRKHNEFSLNGKDKGIYVVNIILEDTIKTTKIRLK